MRIALLPKAIYRLHAAYTKIPMIFFTYVGENDPKIHMLTQNISYSRRNSGRMNIAGGHNMSDFKLNYKVIVAL